MNNDCQLVIFSDKAYNAIIRETFEWEPVETGGILLGHILDNGCWLVMEVLPPGYGEGREGDNVHHEYGYFEYNQRFVNYLAKSVAEQYEIPLDLLGLWHRHPGSMDVFSGTDDVTNSKFAAQNPQGVISGIVNVDPQLRMTMYHLAHNAADGFGKPPYQRVEVEVVDAKDIPEVYRKLRFYDGSEKTLHPYAPQVSRRHQSNYSRYDGSAEQRVQPKKEIPFTGTVSSSSMPSITKWLEGIKKKNLIILIIAVVCFLISLKPLGKNIERINKLFDKEVTSPCGGQETKEQASNNKTQGDTPTDVRELDNIDNQESVGATNENQKE